MIYNDRITEHSREIVRMLRQAREAKGMTQSDLARRMGRVQSRISEVESGEADPRLSTASFMADALDQQFVLVPKERVRDVRQLLGRPIPTVQTTHSVPSVFEEVFVPDPVDEE